MLPWWGWLVLWVCLLLASAALLGWVGWRTWKSLKALTRELGTAERLLAALEAQRDRLTPQDTSPPRLAVFDNPMTLAGDYLTDREERVQARRRRRSERLPGWARPADAPTSGSPGPESGTA